jgi:hypothetical protein
MKSQCTIIDSIILILGLLLLLAEEAAVHSFVISPIGTNNSKFLAAVRRRRATIRRKVGDDGGDYVSTLTLHPSTSSSRLFLHVESLHPHRDSLLTLTDPVVLPPDDDDNQDKELHSTSSFINSNKHVEGNTNNNNNNKDVEPHKSFFADRRHRIAPIALTLYAFGNYLNTHTHNNPAMDTSSTASTSSTSLGDALGLSIDVDPMMLGGALIAIGLITVMWTMDEIVHVVRQYMTSSSKADE